MTEEDRVKHSKHTEQIEYINYNSDEEYVLDEEDEHDKDDEEDFKQFNIICKIRLAMIKYIDDNALPLGSLLDQNAIENFISDILQ